MAVPFQTRDAGGNGFINLISPFFEVSTANGNTTEAGGKVIFTVKLGRMPDNKVVVDVQSLNTNEGTVSPSKLVFTTSDWNNSKTVTIKGVDDDQVDGDVTYVIQLVLNSGDTLDTTGYTDLDPYDVSLLNIDDDLSKTAGNGISLQGGSGGGTSSGGTSSGGTSSGGTSGGGCFINSF